MNMSNEVSEKDEWPDLNKDEIRKIKALEKSSAKLEPKIRRTPRKTDRAKLCDSINSRLSEYCDSYIFLGFDTNGQETVLLNIQSPLEHRALMNLLEEFTSNTLGGGFHMIDDDD